MVGGEAATIGGVSPYPMISAIVRIPPLYPDGGLIRASGFRQMSHG